MTINKSKSSDIVWHHATVTRERRQQLNGHKSLIIWFTGLSASGKSTLAHAVEEELYQRGCRTFVMDGDNVRHGLCADLDFSDQARKENIRRIGETSKLMLEAGIIVLTAFISPFRDDRDRVRGLLPHGEFIEVFCDCAVEVCESRDPKGLYQKAREGKIPNFTGISSPYERPVNPEITLKTDAQSLDECVSQLIAFLITRGAIEGD